MPLDEDKIKDLEDTLISTLKPAFAVATVANPAAASILFGVELVFRFARLGAQIRQELEKDQKPLDEAIRAEGIFRLPVRVAMKYAAVLSFIEESELNHPFAYDQFEAEREVITDKSHPGWQEAFDTLSVASRIVPELGDDLTLRDRPVLDDLYAKWLDPRKPNYRSLVVELKALGTKDALSITELKDLLPAYSRMKLESMGADLEELTENALENLNKKVGDLIWDAVLGKDGAAGEVVNFAVERRLEQIDNEATALRELKAELEKKAASELTDAEKGLLENIPKDLQALTRMKERIESALES
jgi:hypothetical protein